MNTLSIIFHVYRIVRMKDKHFVAGHHIAHLQPYTLRCIYLLIPRWQVYSHLGALGIIFLMEPCFHDITHSIVGL